MLCGSLQRRIVFIDATALTALFAAAVLHVLRQT
jgi:hypothetical protein